MSYLLFFRMDLITEGKRPNQAELDGYMVDWMKWIESIAARGKLADGGNHLSDEGYVVTASGSEKRIFREKTQSLTGYIIVEADSDAEALDMARGCPLLRGDDTSVEVRKTDSPGRA